MINDKQEADDDPINLYIVLSDLKFQLDQKSKDNQRLTEHIRTQDE
jgi:hypothetical protein